MLNASRPVGRASVIRNMVAIAAICAASVLAGTAALAQEGDGPSVLILGSPAVQPYCEAEPDITCLDNSYCDTGDSCVDPWNEDIRDKLEATGLFSQIDIFRIDLVNPSQINFNNYDSVLVYSDSAIPPYYEPTPEEIDDGYIEFGDYLADYIDAGGGVVVAVFANASLPFSGRFNDEDYWVITPLWQSQDIPLTLGTVYDADSPLLAGVTTLSGGSGSYISTGVLHPDAERVADWSNGAPLVAKRKIGAARRVDLNLYPPSSAIHSSFWDEATDGAQLIANALAYVTCGGDTDGDLVCNAHDNCVRTANPNQIDSDSNGVGDMCEPLTPGVSITEVFYHQIAFNIEFIELYAAVTDGPIDITGWRVTDQDEGEIDFQFSSADPRFTCDEPFILNFRDRVVLRQGSIPAGSQVLCTGPVRMFWLLNSADQLQNDGDDIVLQAADGSCRDYMQYENGANVNLPPADCSWTGPNPSNDNQQGISISLFDADPFTDTNSGLDWERSGRTTTIPPRTQGTLNEAGRVDRDRDNVLDGADNCPDNPNGPCSVVLSYCDADRNGTTTAEERAMGYQLDTDSDGLGDACDDDRDNDGLLNADDNCPFVSNVLQENADSDGFGDACDVCPLDALNDSDSDGHCADVDNCPTLWNAGQNDAESDGVGDACDNCVYLYNRSQQDSDSDGSGDVCDNCPYESNPVQEDTDGDQVGDLCDNCPLDHNPGQSDADSDGIGDVCALVVFFGEPSQVQWQDVPSYISYDFFKGDLEVLKATGVYTQEPGSNPLAEQICGTTNSWSDDSDTPSPGKVIFYLVSGSFGSSSSGLGTDSSGEERPDTSDCQ